MHIKILFLILITASISGAVETRNKVEELFIWKISDELKLTVPEEKKLADYVRDLNRRRFRVNEDIQLTLKKLSSNKDREKILSEHRKLLKSYSDLSIEEADRIQKILGVDKAAQYFVLKNDLTNRLKSMLATPDKKNAEPLAPPKVIEEN